jgi:hypothetical protein
LTVSVADTGELTPTFAVMVTTVVEVTTEANVGKLVVLLPAGIITLPPNDTTGLSLARETMMSSLGRCGSRVIVTVPVQFGKAGPPTTGLGLNESELTVAKR